MPAGAPVDHPEPGAGWQRLWSVLEGATATGAADELLEHVAVDLPEGSRLGHFCQVVHTELEAELFQVLMGQR